MIELLMIPSTLPRFMRLPGKGSASSQSRTSIRAHFDQLFPGFDKVDAGAFRLIRDSDIEVQEEAEDLVRYFRSAIKRRRRGRVIRLEFDAETPTESGGNGSQGSRRATSRWLRKAPASSASPTLASWSRSTGPTSNFRPTAPRFPERIMEHDGDCFAAIRAKDFIVHHPYESFEVVVAFLRQAAEDPDVVAIKQTLYRAGKQSAIIDALVAAAEAGKSVTAVVELKARFDEEQNLLWASRLERAGVQVIYGFVEWKTHAKVSMVIRREGGVMRTYCHFGTGNYHPTTARIYTDLSYFTSSAARRAMPAKLFNLITGYVTPKGLELLTLCPRGMRDKILALIDAEIANAKEGKPAAVWAKMNSLVDRIVIDKLYEASEAGVSIELDHPRRLLPAGPASPACRRISGSNRSSAASSSTAASSSSPTARGCRSRKARVYISSADWMPRNFDRRVEYMMPIENPTVHAQVLDQVMIANLIDNEQSWVLDSDGSYTRHEARQASLQPAPLFHDQPVTVGARRRRWPARPCPSFA